MLKTKRNRFECPFLLLALVAPAYGQGQELEFSGGVTGVALNSSESAFRSDRTVSADLFIEKPTGGGRWLAYVEANSTLDQLGLSTLIVESNADAGTALDPDRNGRVQLSEFNYRFDLSGKRITVGLMDPSAFLDRSRITNDENVQFLGASFVNNPTIEFPDYTMGAAYERPAGPRLPQLNVVLASSNGIADNPNLSYSQLIQVTEDDKGAFGAVGFGWLNEKGLLRVGTWFNTRDHATLSGAESGVSNYGIYAVMGRSWNDHGVNLRLGLADHDVTQGSEFVALAYRRRWRGHAVGIGVARTFLSDKEPDVTLDDSTQIEAFIRFAVNGATHLTVSVQKIENSGFNAIPSDPRSSLTVAGLRFHYSF